MKLIWIDLETTGLDPKTDQILEVALAVADIASPFELTRFYNAARSFKAVDTLSPFILDMHTKNGLLAACAESTFELGAIEDELLTLVPWVEDKEERPVLAGSTVHFDHGFLRVHMPRLAKKLSHRHYDVSAIKLFCQSLGMPKLPKAEAHRALEDVLESARHAEHCKHWITAQKGFGQ